MKTILFFNIFLSLHLVLNAQIKHNDSIFSIQRQNLEKTRIAKITDSIEENHPDRYTVNYQKNPVKTRNNKIVPHLALAQFARIPILVYSISHKSGSAPSGPLYIDIDSTVLIYAGIRGDSIIGFKEYGKKQHLWHPVSKNINQQTSENLIKAMNFLGGFSNDYFLLMYKPRGKEMNELAVGFKQSGMINIITCNTSEIIRYYDVQSWVNKITK